jgi:hypothetical protein
MLRATQNKQCIMPLDVPIASVEGLRHRAAPAFSTRSIHRRGQRVMVSIEPRQILHVPGNGLFFSILQIARPPQKLQRETNVDER